MPDHKMVYQQKAVQYQELISREDYLGNLLPEIEKIISLQGKDLVDLGTGTGRLAHLLAPWVKSVHALDSSLHMLGAAAELLRYQKLNNWQVTVGDHRWIPLADNSADLIVSGWSICYLMVWEGDKWKKEVEKALQEIKRVLRKGGMLIIIETLGTGNKDPVEIDKLKPYLNFLEDIGFQKSWIRTDYCFINRKEAQELVEFFFGEEMVDKIGNEEQPVLPECTGLWWITP